MILTSCRDRKEAPVAAQERHDASFVWQVRSDLMVDHSVGAMELGFNFSEVARDQRSAGDDAGNEIASGPDERFRFFDRGDGQFLFVLGFEDERQVSTVVNANQGGVVETGQPEIAIVA